MTFKDTLYAYLYNKSEAIDDYYTRLADNYRIFSADEMDYIELLIARTRKRLIDEIQQEIVALSVKIK